MSEEQATVSTPFSVTTDAAGIADDRALNAAFDRATRDNVPADAGGFASDAGVDDGLDGFAGDGSATELGAETAAVLPTNWQGLEPAWEALPEELRGAVAEREQELHRRMSDQGRMIAEYRPLGEVLGEFSDYFDGTLANHKPEEAVHSLFAVARAMEADPVKTVLDIVDRYQIGDQFRSFFANNSPHAPAGSGRPEEVFRLEQEIAGLKGTIEDLDPTRIDGRVSSLLRHHDTRQEISRFATGRPLFDTVQHELPYFIERARAKLGPDAGRARLLETAYQLAIEADPDMRAQTQAADTAARANANRSAAAKSANSVNVKSTASGRPRQPSEDELLSATYDKMKAS
jgi:hypothetical protein